MTPAPSTPLDVDTLADDELLAAVADNADSAVAARGELYRRHVRYLYGAVSRRQEKLLAVAGLSAEDLVQDTFHRAFERASTFRSDGITDPERLRRRARAWLGRIAQNLLADALSRAREISATPYLERVSCEGIDREQPASKELRLVQEGLEELSEREQDVLRITALYHRAGGHQRLPNSVARELAARWQTTSDNIRAIRSRAMKKLRAFVTERDATLREAP